MRTGTGETEGLTDGTGILAAPWPRPEQGGAAPPFQETEIETSAGAVPVPRPRRGAGGATCTLPVSESARRSRRADGPSGFWRPAGKRERAWGSGASGQAGEALGKRRRDGKGRDCGAGEETAGLLPRSAGWQQGWKCGNRAGQAPGCPPLAVHRVCAGAV